MKRNNTKRFLALLMAFAMIAASGVMNTGMFLLANESDDTDRPDTQVVEEVVVEEEAEEAAEEVAAEPAAEETAEEAATDETAEAAEASEETAESADAAEEQAAEEDALTAEDAAEASDEALLEEEEEEAEEDAEEAEAVFDGVATVDGVKVSVKADKGVFPADAKLVVTKVAGSKLSKVESAVADEADGILGGVVAFDITITDADGNEIQPDTEKGDVTVSFAKAAVMDKTDANSADELHVYHMNDSLSNAEELDASVSGSEISVDADHFSVYVAGVAYDTLNEAIKAAEDGTTIDLQGEIVEVSKLERIINKSITIKNGTVVRKDGYKATMLGTGKNGTLTLEKVKVQGNDDATGSMLDINGGTMYLNTDTQLIENKMSGNGAAMKVSSGTLYIDGATIENNESTEKGGAIYARNATIYVKSGKLSGNKAAKSGGAIYADSTNTINISGGTFSGNSAKAGGAVYAEGDLTVTYGTFTGNSVSGTNGSYGGAIYATGSKNVSISRADFSSNESSVNGGAVAIGTSGSISVENCTFTENKAKAPGGGIWVQSKSDVTIKGNKFTGNTGKTGGGLYVSGPNSGNESTILSEGNTYTGNTASGSDGYGGGAYIVSDSVVKVSGDTYTENTSNAYGGGLAVWGGAAGTATIENTKVTGNKAANGAGIALASQKTTLTSVTVTDNNASSCGGAILVRNASDCTINSGTFTGNSAAAGGVVYSYGSTVNVNDGTFKENTSSKNGGAFYLHSLSAKDSSASPVINIAGGKVTNNTAQKNGGAVYAYDGTVKVASGAEVYNNTASTAGDDIYAAANASVELGTAYEGILDDCSDKIDGWYDDSAENRWAVPGCAGSGTHADEITAGTYTGVKAIKAAHGNAAYTVKFDKNGGSGSMDDQAMTVDNTETLNANEFTRTGYTFNGWNTEKDGSGDSYSDKQEVTNLAAKGGEITLYAQWTPESHKATIKYQDENGNSLGNGNPVTYKTGDSGIRIGIPSRTGYTPSKIIIDGKELSLSAGENTRFIEFTENMSMEDHNIVIVYTQNQTTPATTDDDDDDDNNTTPAAATAAAAPAAAPAAVPMAVVADTNDDGEVELTEVPATETPAALLEDEHLCNLIPFLLMAVAMVVEAFNNKNSKNHKKRMEDLLA